MVLKKLEGSQGRESGSSALSPPLGGGLGEGDQLDWSQSSPNAYVMKKNHDWSGSMYIEIHVERPEEFNMACALVDEAYTYPTDIGYMILDTDYILKTQTNVRKN